ncbi:MAG: deoxyribodipyrimidine photo-lyase [Paracoccaceae bacterium]
MDYHEKKTVVNIVWFKKDLRSSDHAPLYEAALGEYPVLPIYVFEPDYWEQEDAALRHWDFTKQSLEFLRADLSTLGQALVFRQGKILQVFEDLRKEFDYKCHLFSSRNRKCLDFRTG